ncbi:MAG: MFS transporter [Methanobacteriota archaeon]|nr:MAG: MFS transporter [Euryarchaeota archaeon]
MSFAFSQNLAFQYIPLFNKKLGANEIEMGLMTAVQNVFSTAFSPFWGRISDAHGRKLFLLLGSFIATASAGTLTFAKNPLQVIVSIAVNSFGLSMLVPAWQGALADYTEGSKRGGFMGRITGVAYLYVTITLALYSFVAPLLEITEIQQYRVIMATSAVNFLIMVVLSWILIDLKDPNGRNREYSLLASLRDRIYRRFLAVILFWWFWMSLAWSYFPTVIAVVIDASVSEVAWIAITGTVVQAIASYRMGSLIDRIGERRSIIYGFITFTIVPLNFAFATEWWHLIPAQIIAGVGIGFGFTALQTYILEIAGSEKAGNYQGTYNLLWGALTFVGSYFGGWFLQWLKGTVGSLPLALTYALLIVTVLRFFSNFIMYFFLPDPYPKQE